MADIGQTSRELELKMAETELTIEEKMFAQKKIRLELMRLEVKKELYSKSLVDIEAQLEANKADLASLTTAMEAARSKEITN